VHGRIGSTDRVLLFQSVVKAAAASGDSGSPVFAITAGGRNVILYGILWGGVGSEYVFSPMSAIEAELGSLTTFNTPPTGNDPKPDLIPVRRPNSSGPEGFCRLSTGGELIVRVRNQSNLDVNTETTTIVRFSGGDFVFRPTPPIAGGASADISFPIPSGCGSDCSFTIAVDAAVQVHESRGDEIDTHETNNIQNGRCIG